jgi:hypothetical protein
MMGQSSRLDGHCLSWWQANVFRKLAPEIIFPTNGWIGYAYQIDNYFILFRNTSSWQHNHDRKNIAHCHPSSHPHTKKLLFNGQNDHMKMVIPFIAFLPSPIKII